MFGGFCLFRQVSAIFTCSTRSASFNYIGGSSASYSNSGEFVISTCSASYSYIGVFGQFATISASSVFELFLQVTDISASCGYFGKISEFGVIGEFGEISFFQLVTTVSASLAKSARSA